MDQLLNKILQNRAFKLFLLFLCVYIFERRLLKLFIMWLNLTTAGKMITPNVMQAHTVYQTVPSLNHISHLLKAIILKLIFNRYLMLTFHKN